MTSIRNLFVTTFTALFLFAATGTEAQGPAAPLPSWSDGTAKQSILSFVSAVTDKDGKDFVAPPQRIAVFDNDGTLWAEQPIYFEIAFMLDRIKALAPEHPEWKTEQPFKAVLDGDRAMLAALPRQDLEKLFVVSHTGMTEDQFRVAVRSWLGSAKHPKFQVPYFNLVYQPMLELLSYLRDNGFKTYIVTGGTVEFVRAFAESVYGIPPEQVIGTTVGTKFQIGADGAPEIMREAKVDFFDDGPAKPVAINRVIGRRPIFAFGNSDGDKEMLEWTAAGSGLRFEGLVHHTDAAREFAYDRAGKIGTLDKALAEANAKGWTVVDMKQDWRAIFGSVVAAQSAASLSR
jgi:phosphoglycolate phosphatase-like HAD superfamily hydrolase